MGVSFAITPLNWWARYTIWIYALGLPCFALILSKYVFNQKKRAFSKHIASVWMIICLGFLLFEAGYCLKYIADITFPGSFHDKLTQIVSPSTWNRPCCSYYPEIHGTILETVLSQGDNVATGPFIWKMDWDHVYIISELSQRIGAKRLSFIDVSQLQDAIAQIKKTNVKYILWDETNPLPATLKSLAITTSNADGFIVLTLR